jgi:hypothetical protein
VDLIARTNVGRLTIFDFKTKKFKVDRKGAFYTQFWDDNVRQLAAYRGAMLWKQDNDWGGISSPEEIDVVNVGINSIEPGPFVLRQWTEDEVWAGQRVFNHCVVLWQMLNNYAPKQ